MKQPVLVDKNELSLNQGRIYILLAAVLWSTSGFFAKVLTEPSWLGLDEPKIYPLQMAFYRVLFAGFCLVPLLKPAEMTIKPAMIGMALCFALMNAMYISALAEGTAANAILLQYTAPIWMYLACIWLLGEKAEWRNSVMVVVGVLGVAVIVVGGWQGEQLRIILLGLGSGLTYAGILIFLRVLRSSSSSWLTVWNHLTAAILLAPFGLMLDFSTWTGSFPTWPQLIFFILFGSFQLGFPYFLIARGLRVVSPQEAGAICLLEPLLSPVWAYFVAPEKETPSIFTFIGGALILGGLAWRYWPRKTKS